MILLLAAGGLAGGAPLPLLALSVAAVAAPWPTAALVLVAAAWTLRQRRPSAPTAPEVGVLVAIASELRAGATLRQALAGARSQLPALEGASRLALAGRPMTEVAPALAAALGPHGSLAGAAVRLAERVGGSLAPVFDELAAQAIDADELRRERRAAMAPAVAQGIVVGGLPVLALVYLAGSGRLAALASGSTLGAAITATGVVLTLAGVSAVAVLVWRALR